MDTGYFKKLFEYNDWANLILADSAARLDDPAYRRDFGQAWGSVHGTLAHLAAADAVWMGRWQGTSLPLKSGDDYATLADLRQDWERIMADRRAFVESLTSEKLEAPISYVRKSDNKPFSEPLWAQMAHVANHGTDHRSHLSIMLTEMGFAPPPLDLIEWARQTM
jgi:uncharacterized damage-inducible protein DinB